MLIAGRRGELLGALTYLHSGSFSGSARSLLHALDDRVDVDAVDLMPLGRHPRLLPARLLAKVEAKRAGSSVPWTKTATWSRAIQGELERTGRLSGNTPLLVVQSIPALDLDEAPPYAIYTDRVGREGAAVSGQHASRFSDGWLDRETAFLQGAGRVFVMGPTTADALTSMYGLPPERIQVIGAGPNSDLGPPRPRTRPRRLVFVGTQWNLKGGPELLRAYEIIKKDRADLELVLVGSGPSEPLPEGVTAYGRVPHDRMNEVYDETDVLVIPTHMEAFGIALLEGLIKGLPCICSTVGNQPWLVGDAGIAVDPGDVTELISALRKVLDDFTAFHQRALDRGAALGDTMTWSHVADAILDDVVIK